jgi:hypothetical protein
VNGDLDLFALPFDLALPGDVLTLPFELPPPPIEPPVIAGGILGIEDIYHAVEQFLAFISYPNQIRGWLWDNVIMKAWDHLEDKVNWLWNNATSPAFTWTNGLIENARTWLWNTAIYPAFTWTNGLIENARTWLWNNAIYPAFTWTNGLIENARTWLWNNAISPAFTWTNGLIENARTWLWNNAISPAFTWTNGLIENARTWLWDNAIYPAFEVVGDLLNDLKSIGEDTKSFVTNNVWPAVQSLPEHITNVVISGAEAIGSGFQNALQWLFEHVFDPVADAIAVKLSIPRKLLTGQYRSIEDLLKDIEDPFGTSSIAAYLWALPSATLALIPTMLEMGSIIFRGDVYRMAREIGPTIPTFADLRDAYLRGIMLEKDHDYWLGAAGFSEDNILNIKLLYYDIPTPSDLVRMAVREVFSHDVAQRFGQYDEFPDAFGLFARATGIGAPVRATVSPNLPGYSILSGLGDLTWAHMHWAAHWDLPSATQGFDMFHRALDEPAEGTEAAAFTIGSETFYHVISSDTLQLLLRTLDYMPFWRPKLTAVAFRPVSRIDIRRMFATGAADYRDVLRTYLSLGYTPDDALKLTDYVTRDAAAVSKDLSRETIVNFYRDRILSRDEATSQLLELGFSDEAVEMLLDQADLAVEKQMANLAEDVFEQDFKAGVITEQELRNDLAFIGVPGERIELLVRLWTRQLAVKPARLSTSQVQRLYHENIIGQAQATELLSNLGHNNTTIGWLLQLATPPPDLPPARELSKEDLKACLTHNLLVQGEVRTRLLNQGYAAGDADLLLQLWTPEPKEADLTKADLKNALVKGILSEQQVRDSLQRLGYSPQEADAYISLWTPEPKTADLSRADVRAAFRAGLLSEVDARNWLTSHGYDATEAGILIDTWRPAPAAAT